MRMYFLRHTEAAEGADDEARELTTKGRRDARRVGRYLRTLGVRLDRAYTSPLVRARQTAERVLAELRVGRRFALEETAVLANDASVAAFRQWLKKLPKAESILLVGHEPSMGKRVGMLAGGVAVPMSKGALARVDVEEADRRRGVLRLLIGPRQIP